MSGFRSQHFGSLPLFGFQKVMLSNISRRFFFTVAVSGLVLGLYLGLRPSPAFGTVKWIPTVFANLADRYGRFRNMPAFAMLTFAFLLSFRSSQKRFLIILLLGLLGAAIEGAQLFIPTRVSDIWDVFWSWVGICSAWVVFESGRRLAQRW